MDDHGFGRSAGAGDEKQKEGEQAGEHRPNPPVKEAASMRQRAAP